MNHPLVSGNKWWKLKYNLEAFSKSGKKNLLTFGGAYSNHLYATAAACRELNIASIGIVRGEMHLPLNHTLSFAEQCGMKLHYIDRATYRSKYDESFLGKLRETYGEFFMIPEGGTNEAAVRGCAEFARTQLTPSSGKIIFLPAGTGGTTAGLLAGVNDDVEVVAVSVLRGGEFLRDEILTLAKEFLQQAYGNFELLTSYHHGGYGKISEELLAFIAMMEQEHQLPLDPLYTGKMMWAILKEIEAGAIKRGTTVLALHTGGLQGRQGFMKKA